jgi:TM2 domain-containing membrane protein YozV
MPADSIQFANILRKIFNDYGAEIIKDTNRLNALLMDLAPENAKERKLVIDVLKEGIGSNLYNVLGKSQAEQMQCLKTCIYNVTTSRYIPNDIAEYAVSLLANTLGINCEIKSLDKNMNGANNTANEYGTAQAKGKSSFNKPKPNPEPTPNPNPNPIPTPNPNPNPNPIPNPNPNPIPTPNPNPTPTPVKAKKKQVNKVNYCLLALFFGWLGIHKFYSGKILWGILYMIFCWTYVPLIISLIELIIALCKKEDYDGKIWI